MLLNPYTAHDKLATVGDTNILEESFGIIGQSFEDTLYSERNWTVYSLYAPVRGRALGGIRAKLVDEKGFVTFCNQRDLEVLLDIVNVGSFCSWLSERYPGPGDRKWVGLCMDEEDLVDDLFDRECEIRAMDPSVQILPPGLGLQRRLHLGDNNDCLEDLTLISDIYLETGYGPDTRFETIERRWSRVQRLPERAFERNQLWRSLSA
jgi:hypothetical protein